MGSADNSDIIGFIFNFNIYAYLAELRGDRLQVLRYYILSVISPQVAAAATINVPASI